MECNKTNKMKYVPRKSLDQPGHLPSLIRVFTVSTKKPWVLSYPLRAQWRLWSCWGDVQADLSLRLAHSHFVGFVLPQLNLENTASSKSVQEMFQYPCCMKFNTSKETVLKFCLTAKLKSAFDRRKFLWWSVSKLLGKISFIWLWWLGLLIVS